MTIDAGVFWTTLAQFAPMFAIASVMLLFALIDWIERR